jgi:hypothetical protein
MRAAGVPVGRTHAFEQVDGLLRDGPPLRAGIQTSDEKGVQSRPVLPAQRFDLFGHCALPRQIVRRADGCDVPFRQCGQLIIPVARHTHARAEMVNRHGGWHPEREQFESGRGRGCAAEGRSVSVPRKDIDEHFAADQSKCVHIGGSFGLLSLQSGLRRSVQRSAGVMRRRPQFGARNGGVSVRQSHICEQTAVLCVKQDIFRFDVAMDDVERVHVQQTRRNVQKPMQSRAHIPAIRRQTSG